MNNCKTPGLFVAFSGQSHRLYATLMHTGSGKAVRHFTQRPITGGKRRFCAAVDAALSRFDWQRPVMEIAADDAAKNAVRNIGYDFQ